MRRDDIMSLFLQNIYSPDIIVAFRYFPKEKCIKVVTGAINIHTVKYFWFRHHYPECKDLKDVEILDMGKVVRVGNIKINSIDLLNRIETY